MKRILGFLGSVCLMTGTTVGVVGCVPGSLTNASKVDLDSSIFKWQYIGSQIQAERLNAFDCFKVIDQNVKKFVPMARRDYDYVIWNRISPKPLKRQLYTSDWTEIMLESTNSSKLLFNKIIFSCI